MNSTISTPPVEELREEPEKRPFWQVPCEFAIHTIVGTFIFAVIATGAVLLDLTIHRLQGHQISALIINGLKLAAYSSFGVDLSLYLIFLWRTTLRAGRRL